MNLPEPALGSGEKESPETAKGRGEKEETRQSRGGGKSAGGQLPTAARGRRPLRCRGRSGSLLPAAHGAGAWQPFCLDAAIWSALL